MRGGLMLRHYPNPGTSLTALPPRYPHGRGFNVAMGLPVRPPFGVNLEDAVRSSCTRPPGGVPDRTRAREEKQDQRGRKRTGRGNLLAAKPSGQAD